MRLLFSVLLISCFAVSCQHIWMSDEGREQQLLRNFKEVPHGDAD